MFRKRWIVQHYDMFGWNITQTPRTFYRWSSAQRHAHDMFSPLYETRVERLP